jgi:AraC-like DNA-binding protein
MFLSTLSSYALVVAKTLDARGVDSRALFRRAGLDPDDLRDPNARFPFLGMQKVWALAVEETGDPCFGLSIVRNLHPTSLHALGFSWLASASLRDGFSRLSRYARIVSSVIAIDLDCPEESACRLRVTTPGFDLDTVPASRDAGMASLVRLCRSSCGEQFHPLRVTLTRPRPPCDQAFQDFFRAPIEYAADAETLWFGREQIDMPLPTANADLAMANDRILTEYLADLERNSITLRTKAAVIERLPAGTVSTASIARALNMSPRTLQRRLRAEGTGYKELLDETRRELAAQYIRSSRYSINEITFLLGFSDVSNFSRAFKRWEGVSPSSFRLMA